MKLKNSQRRTIMLIITLVFISSAVLITLKVFNDNIVFFLSPNELLNSTERYKKELRLGGLVKKGSIIYSQDTNILSFIITDLVSEVHVRYKGVVPSLFKEESGTVVLGLFNYDNKIFDAHELLAKHDENYMPKEVADAIKKSGQWKNGNK